MTHQPIELIARGLLVRDNAVLLCKSLPGQYLYLPGGHIEFGEPAAAALEREFLEETGLSCRAGTLLGAHEEVFDQRGRARHEINLVFHVEHLDLSPGAHPPIPSREPDIAFEWLDLAGAVSADIRPASVRAWLASGAPTDRATATWWSAVRPTHPGGPAA